MAKREIDVGISEDGKNFTVVTDDDSLTGITDDEEEVELDDDGNEIVHEDESGDKDEPLFDKETLLKDVPEEHKAALLNVISQAEGVISSKLTEADAWKAKAEMTEVLLEKLSTITQRGTQESTHAAAPKEKPKLEESFKFEENDYYAPLFKKMLGVIEGLESKIDGVQASNTQDKVETLKGTVRGFFAANKVDRPVIAKMDEIAQDYGKDAEGNFVAYKNLPRLLNLAKSELGISTVKPKPKARPKVNPRKQIESGSLRKSVRTIADKPAGTMMEAFNQTLEQLNE